MIVVIGATGFLGSHLLCHLVQNDEKIRAIYRNKESITLTEGFLQFYTNVSPQLFKEKIEWIQADVLDIESLILAFQGATYIYNCSGYVSFDKCDKEQMIAVNVTGTANIVNACLHCNCTKLVHVSSIAALGETNTSDSITEEIQWIRNASESWYSITKFYAETEVWRGIAEGLSAVIVNPSVIIGPGDWSKGSPTFFTIVYDGLKYYTNGIVGFVDVRDLCRAMIQVMNSTINGERFVVSGSNESYQELFTKIALAINKPIAKHKATALMLSIAWKIEWLRSFILGTSPLITKNSARTAGKKSFYSSQKLIIALRFDFTPFDKTIEFTGNCFLNSK